MRIGLIFGMLLSVQAMLAQRGFVVAPKGMTFGLNGALGKWFTPELGLRGRVQWENGLIPNNGVE